jgi:circadian clock protein KaiC
VHFVEAACRRGERALYFAFEESPGQIARNMASIGIDVMKWIRSGRLRIRSMRPTTYGLEMHLAEMHRAVEEHDPEVLVIDPISSLMVAGAAPEVRSMLLRFFDFLKSRQITALGTSLTTDDLHSAMTDGSISSVMDVWLQVRGVESNGERNRLLGVLKARGIAHSNQVREFQITSQGVKLVDVYLGSGAVLTGSARVVQQTREEAAALARAAEEERRRGEIEERRRALRERIAAMNTELARADSEVRRMSIAEARLRKTGADSRMAIARSRQALPRRRGSGTSAEGNGR